MTLVEGTGAPLWVPFITVVIALELVADVVAKEFALHGGAWRMGLAVTFVIAGNLTWQFALRTGVGLARAGMLYAVGVALGAALIGVIGYGEGLTHKQTIGAVLALVVLVLLG